jgi:hypothetical protein
MAALDRDEAERVQPADAAWHPIFRAKATLRRSDGLWENAADSTSDVISALDVDQPCAIPDDLWRLDAVCLPQVGMRSRACHYWIRKFILLRVN